jgi:hypothetical protein
MYQLTAQRLDLRIIRTDIGSGLRQFAEELNDFGPQLAAILYPLQPTRLNRGVIPQRHSDTLTIASFRTSVAEPRPLARTPSKGLT